MDSMGQIIRILVYTGNRVALEKSLSEEGTNVPLNGSHTFGDIQISSTVARADVLCSACLKNATTCRSLICIDCQIQAEKLARKAFEEGDINAD